MYTTYTYTYKHWYITYILHEFFFLFYAAYETHTQTRMCGIFLSLSHCIRLLRLHTLFTLFGIKKWSKKNVIFSLMPSFSIPSIWRPLFLCTCLKIKSVKAFKFEQLIHGIIISKHLYSVSLQNISFLFCLQNHFHPFLECFAQRYNGHGCCIFGLD